MNHKTKKELWDELQGYKKQVQQYEDFWEVKIIDEYERKMKRIYKILKFIILILLLASAFLLGMII